MNDPHTAARPATEPGDIVLVRGQAFFSRLIRIFTRAEGEPPTVVNHVGIMVTSADIVESLSTTVRRDLVKVYQGGNRIYIVRKNNLGEIGQQAVVKKAVGYVGKRYGWLKIVAHGLDRLIFRGRYVVRRLAVMDNYPICSWVVAWAYWEAGVVFGVPPNAATPDDIWDWVMEKHPEDWTVVRTTTVSR